jgi:brefeldin A-inhibited guanine nucleotide-exchange protein
LIFILIDFRFAKKPKQGIRFLQEKGLLGNTAADIALFFYRDERLDKTAIGDYLGEGDE